MFNCFSDDAKLARLALLQIIAIFLASGSVWALGLGQIRVKAMPHRMFKAEIPLLIGPGEEDVSASAGTRMDYDMLQLQRRDFVDSLKVTVKNDPLHPGGKMLEISATKPVKQSAFNLLIRATAGGGTILENFFLVLDFRKSLSLELPEEQTAKTEKRVSRISRKKARKARQPRVQPREPVPEPEKLSPPPPPPPPIFIEKAKVEEPEEPEEKTLTEPEPKREIVVERYFKEQVVSRIPAPPPPMKPKKVVPAPKPEPEPAPQPVAPVVVASKEDVKKPSPKPVPTKTVPEQEFQKASPASKQISPVVVVKQMAEPKPAVSPPQEKVEIPAAQAVPAQETAGEKEETAQTASASTTAEAGGAIIKVDSVIVARGETLFGIIRKLGVPLKKLPALSVAAFKENLDAFINHNINLLKAGANLKLDNIEKTALQLTPRDIRDALYGPKKKSASIMKPRPVSILALPSVKPIATQEIYAFLDGCKKEWMRGKEEALAADYGESFRDSRGRSKPAFLSRRFAFNAGKENIKLTFENISIFRGGNYVSVYFNQTFSSNTYLSAGLKRLKLIKTDKGLKIVSEEFLHNRAVSGKHSWNVYLAYADSLKTAKKNIANLRAAGFEAFEAETFLNMDKEGYRILVGRAGTKTQARRMVRNLKNRTSLFARVVSLPFSIRAGVYETRREAADEMQRLAGKGLSPYLMETSENGKPKFGVYLGAFGTRDAAEKALAKIGTNEPGLIITTP
jgi:hypothetical protein